jgi:GGDEF domain-containing protein
VNDSLGIAARDWLLVQIADRLLGSIRLDDALFLRPIWSAKSD